MNTPKIFLGKILNNIPYTFMPKVGIVYNNYRKDILEYETCTDKWDWIFRRVYNIVEYAINNIQFYQDFYKFRGFDINELNSFEDISKIPILTKSDLINIPIETRSVSNSSCRLANTGGSTGMPLSFYKTQSHRIKEMAFYHSAWEKIGYRKHKLRLQFVGRSEQNGCTYDFARNQIRVSIYEPFDLVLHELSQLPNFCQVEFLQGYPSVIYEFALYCSSHNKEYVSSKLNDTLKGIFFNSEYPNPFYRNVIEKTFNVKTIASYGHTEGCALGFDYGDGVYEVLQSYGYCESISMQDGEHLVATSYDNFVSPFIRYDTNDIVENACIKECILNSFTMNEGGRSGQYITDIDGKNISLTGLIFGKHHKIFNYCSQLQISQSEQGKAIIYYVPKNGLPKNFNPKEMFDSDGISIEFSFKEIQEPIRTKAGKVLLLVKEQ